MPELAEVRARVETDLDDATLQTIIDAEIESLEREVGGATAVQTSLASGLRVFTLNRKPASITSIAERRTEFTDPVVLSANDYRMVGNYQLRRLTDGDNPATCWGQEVVVTYAPDIDQNLRDRIVFDLVQIAVEFRAFETEEVGDHKRSETQGAFKERRRVLLAQAHEGRGTIL